MQGRLLVASPSLDDPNFARTVVLLLAHSDEGALGIVLNRPSPAGIEEILPQWRGLAAFPAQVFRGGPVSVSAAICLAQPVASGADADQVAVEGVEATVAGLVSVDLSRDPDSVTGAVDQLRVFSGYAGWSAGQLERELEAGGWILTDPRPEELLTDDPDALWSLVLRRMGGLRSAYAKAPGKLSYN